MYNVAVVVGFTLLQRNGPTAYPAIHCGSFFLHIPLRLFGLKYKFPSNLTRAPLYDIRQSWAHCRNSHQPGAHWHNF